MYSSGPRQLALVRTRLLALLATLAAAPDIEAACPPGPAVYPNGAIEGLVATRARNASLGATDDGRFIVGYESFRPGFTSRVDLYAQRFNADGSCLCNAGDACPALLGSATASASHQLPSVGVAQATAAPDVRVAWMASITGLYANELLMKDFAFDLAPFVPGQQNPTGTGHGDYEPSSGVPGTGAGGTAVTWSRTKPADSPRGLVLGLGATSQSIRDCNDSTQNPRCRPVEWQPCLVSLEDGSALEAWAQDESNDPNPPFDIFLQQYDPLGSPIPTPPPGQPVGIRINQDVSVDATSEESPAVAIGPNGHIVVAWVGRYPDACPPGSGFRIYARRFLWNPSGHPQPLGDQFLVDDPSTGFFVKNAIEGNPSVAITRSTDAAVSGRFVIAWNAETTGVTEIHARLYDTDGSLLGAEFRVNQDTSYTDPFHPEGQENLRSLANSAQHVLAYLRRRLVRVRRRTDLLQLPGVRQRRR